MKRYSNPFKKLSLGLFALAALSACNDDDGGGTVAPEPVPGSANFSTFITVGASFEAGFADGALYRSAQDLSYPKLLSDQLALVGGGDFNQPDLDDATGNGFGGFAGAPSSATAYGRLRWLDLGSGSFRYAPGLVPSEIGQAGNNPTSAGWAYTGNKALLNNFGVPGANSAQILQNGFGTPGVGNPFYTRFASNPNTSSVISDAKARDASFFLLWIGGNDILGYALAGGGAASYTSVSAFTTNFGAAVDSLLASTATTKGAIGNLPDVTNLANFNTALWNLANVTSAGTRNSVNAGWVTYKTNYEAATGRTVFFDRASADSFKLGPNGLMITEADGDVRHATSGDKILLTALTSIGAGAGLSPAPGAGPIAANLVLDAGEIAIIRDAVAGYNAAMLAKVNSVNAGGTVRLAYVDLFSRVDDVRRNGLTVKFGVVDDLSMPYGKLTSSDGIHLTPRGNAAWANWWIEGINATFGSTIPTIDVTQYRGNLLFPAGTEF